MAVQLNGFCLTQWPLNWMAFVCDSVAAQIDGFLFLSVAAQLDILCLAQWPHRYMSFVFTQ